MATGAEMVAIALPHVGEQYENVQVPKNNANWHGPWDCAEFMSWIVFQGAGILYGCLDNNAKPSLADAYTGAWKRDSANLGRILAPMQRSGHVGPLSLSLLRDGTIASC